MSENNGVDTIFCKQVREACHQRMSDMLNYIKEHHSGLKELVEIQLNSISDQLDTSMRDIQNSLSEGSKRMSRIENEVKDNKKELANELNILMNRPVKTILSLVGTFLLIIGIIISSWSDIQLLKSQYSGMRSEIQLLKAHNSEFRIWKVKIDERCVQSHKNFVDHIKNEAIHIKHIE